MKKVNSNVFFHIYLGDIHTFNDNMLIKLII